MRDRILKVGFRTGIAAFLFTVGYDVFQIMQLVGVLKYPLDEIIIYSVSLCITIPFMLEMLSLHYTVPQEKRFWSHAALLFTVLYVMYVTANYVVQLATVIPMSLSGHKEEIELLIQTPHSLFWDFDALGYIFMGIAMLFALPIFERKGFQKWVRLAFYANALVTPIITFVYFYPFYSDSLLLLGLPWAVTAPLAMLMLALMFKKQRMEEC